MSTLNDARDVVELASAFGENDYVGPPQASTNATTSHDTLKHWNNVADQTKQSSTNLPLLAPTTPGSESAEGFVTYTPDHPSHTRVAPQSSSSLPKKPTPARRGRPPKNSINTAPPPSHEPVINELPNPQFNPPRANAFPTFIRAGPPRTNMTQPSILRQPVAARTAHNSTSQRLSATSGWQGTPSYQPKFGSAPSFSSFRQPDWRRLMVQSSQQTPMAQNPLPAHTQNGTPLIRPPSNFAHHAASIFNHPYQRVTPNNIYNTPTNQNFTPQAIHVQPAYDDFLRHLQSSLPDVDVNDLINQLTSNQSALLSNGESLLQQIGIPMINNLAQATTSQASGGNFDLENVNDIFPGRHPCMTNPMMAPVITPIQKPLPSEDDMAKQDQDADENNDEEFHEIETFADYMPAKLTIGQPHPDPVVETSSLATVEPPDIDYKLSLPSKVINKGYLSALQLESVIYACQQHNKLLADDFSRRGFLIGDGAGVGKGRTIAGIIFENYIRGRKKSIWLSVSTDLKLDAERDLRDVGAGNIPVHLLGKFKYGRRIDLESGVIFTTYSGLVSKSQSVRGNLGNRLGQLVSWVGVEFDGVIIFDECHKAKNISMGSNKKQHSKAAEFALEIQNKLPKARVVYASATGASETKHLGYMTRLGIWGVGTPYKDFAAFCSDIEKRGVAAMELVAVDLKTRGSYIARQLSFKTTSFAIRTAPLDDSFIELYDSCVDMWAKALNYFQEAFSYIQGDKRRSRTMWSSYWAAHQKFFKYLCIGAKVPLVVEIAREAIKNNKCVVIGLQSTGEAKTLEALEDGDINEFVSTARATFESLIENHFPGHYRREKPRQPTLSPGYGGPESVNSFSKTGSSKSGSSSTTVDESWHGHDMVKFVVEGGHVKAQLEEGKTNKKQRKPKKENVIDDAGKKRFTKNQKVLDELAKEKRQNRKRSKRALRAERRSLARGDIKSRIKLPEADSSDTEVSNPLSISSSDNTSSGGSSDESDSTYCEDSDTADEDEDESSVTVDESDSDIGACSSAKRARAGSDSDSDIQITAVKPKKNYEVIFLSSDDEDEEDEFSSLKPFEKRLSKMKEELFMLIDNIGPKLPNNTLDDLIDRLGGPSKVAEMTGRKGRVVKDEDGFITYRNRNDEDALENLNIAEKERFMNGEKLIAIISEAASSGISLQADKRVANKLRRVHITIELPWSADRAIQQFGRTHRSNQTSGPEYVFLISELAGEKRFASVVAKRLESLGALTHGDRRANTENRDLSQFNISGKYCRPALEHLFAAVDRGARFANIAPEYNGDFTKDARHAFIGAGLGKNDGYAFVVEPEAIKINIFLNRLLGMKVRIQNSIFKLFTDYMDRVIMRKKVSGQYDAGILELNSNSGNMRCEKPEDFFLRTKSGTIKCTIHCVEVDRGLTWLDAQRLLNDNREDKRSGFYISKNPLTKAQMVYLLIREPHQIDVFRIYKPNMGRLPKSEYWSKLQDKGSQASIKDAREIWTKVYVTTDSQCIHLCFFGTCKRNEAKLKCDIGSRHRKYCILSGGILTAWPLLDKKAPLVTTKLQIVRLKLDAGNKVIGPIIPRDHLHEVRRILQAGENGVEF